jgi:hypothetical protein
VRNSVTKIVCLLAGLLGCTRAARALPIETIQFQDGNVLGVQGVFGSGSNTAYLEIDLNNAAVSYAWQFNWNPGTSVNGWQMMEDIAGTSVLSTNPATTTTTVTNRQGDPNLTLSATYYATYAEHEIINVQFGSATGNNDDWDFYTGTFNAANVSSSDPQGMTWKFSGGGIDNLTLSNNEFLGFVDIYPHPPLPTLTEVPEPTSVLLSNPTVIELPEPRAVLPLCIIAAAMLIKRTRSRPEPA